MLQSLSLIPHILLTTLHWITLNSYPSPYVTDQNLHNHKGDHVLARQFLSRLIFDPEDGSDKFLRNVGSYTDYTALYIGRLNFHNHSNPTLHS
jgi:hypothetical protein